MFWLLQVNAFFASEEEKNLSFENSMDETSAITDASKLPTFICKHCSQECQSAHNLKTHVLAKHIASDR